MTDGYPGLLAVEPADWIDEETLVRTAASLAQASHHVVSEALVAAARDRRIVPALPKSAREAPGEGVIGTIDGNEVRIGRARFVDGLAAEEALAPGATAMSVSIGGRLAGRLIFADRLRPEAKTTLRALRDQGIERIVLLTGDRSDVASAIGRALEVDRVVANATPQEKVATARSEAARGATMMIGDGINDAPALAFADIGVALGARGAAAASQAADMVVMVDRLDRVADAFKIARRSRAIAIQSVVVGIGLSAVGMVAAAFGYLVPIAGALAQEVIDLAVVLNALRALSAGRRPS